MFSTHARAADSEAYRRRAKFEIDRANDFYRFQKFLKEFERLRMSKVPAYKSEKERQAEIYEQARKVYAEWRKKEDAKKPTDEFIERMLAQAAEKEEQEKEKARKDYRAVQLEIERAIANTKLDEYEEFGLDR